MEAFVWLAVAVRIFHVALIVGLGVGSLMAAFGMVPRRRFALIFWPSLFVTMTWMALPVSCPLSDLELWLRQQANPTATYPDFIPQPVTQWLLLATPSTPFLIGGGLLAIALGAFGLWRKPAKV